MSIVLPALLVADQEFVDGLTDALLTELHERTDEPMRVFCQGCQDDLPLAVGKALVFDDPPPCTVPDLLDHPHASGRVAVFTAADIEGVHADAVSEFLTRLALESRARPASRRPVVVAIGGRDHLPRFRTGDRVDVSAASVWWWGRVTRWDTGAVVAYASADWVSGGDVLADARIETIIEVARWDLNLATDLARSWDGDPGTLNSILATGQHRTPPPSSPSIPTGVPPAAILDAWDRREVDLWHREVCHSGRLLASEAVVDQAVWAAQARVYLPWIERRRTELQERLLAVIGASGFASARLDLGMAVGADGPTEIGQLNRIVLATANGHRDLKRAAARLTRARNGLAHLRPLNLAEQIELAAACAFLQQLPR